MRIGDILYFAPGIRFDQVDLNGTDLPQQFDCRIVGFYLEPADRCAQHGFAFAAGVVIVSCIDALARVRFGGKVGTRFKKFVRNELPSFAPGNFADRFYDDFRNGLVHEARIKNGGQFTLDADQTVQSVNGLLLVNPQHLSAELRVWLASYVSSLTSNIAGRQKLAKKLGADLAADFQAATP